MHRKNKILFSTNFKGGHCHSMIGLGRLLKDSGHEVIFLTTEFNKWIFEQNDLSYHTYSTKINIETYVQAWTIVRTISISNWTNMFDIFKSSAQLLLNYPLLILD